jgi:diacylglycerol kinase (CTP)
MTTTGGVTTGSKVSGLPPKPAAKVKRRPEEVVTSNASLKEPEQEKLTGFLSPASAYTRGFGSAYWRNLSRSPSPFGLIPIHREWRAFVHKHEIPRKVLHVSIGFVTLWLYREGAQTVQIHPILLGLLIPIFTVDFVRFRWPEFNRVYIRFLGAFMRESEAHDRYNGVIGYLAGIWVTMYLSKKDVAVMSVLLLSWCDTAASTFGRLWGKYTPRIRRGKSLAGSIAAFAFGVGASVLFWGFIAPQTPEEYNTGINSFAYQGVLTLPAQARGYLGWTEAQSSISGKGALGVVSVVSGLVASVSEAIDVYGFDDNLTIPILCGAGLGAFLWAFGGT